MTNFAAIFSRKKTMSSQRDYTSYAPLITLLVIAVLIGLSCLPRFKVGSVTIKRTNIISDLIQQEAVSYTHLDVYKRQAFTLPHYTGYKPNHHLVRRKLSSNYRNPLNCHCIGPVSHLA